MVQVSRALTYIDWSFVRAARTAISREQTWVQVSPSSDMETSDFGLGLPERRFAKFTFRSKLTAKDAACGPSLLVPEVGLPGMLKPTEFQAVYS
ncbi:MAG: hypothetical protein CMF59_08820 [Leptospiraceae bacterium]|nr:hypothetical protein [Leptospiraceae bacterium]